MFAARPPSRGRRRPPQAALRRPRRALASGRLWSFAEANAAMREALGRYASGEMELLRDGKMSLRSGAKDRVPL